MATANPSSPLRVCVVAPLSPPYGGMAVQAEKLIAGLRSEGIGVSVVRTNLDFPPGFRWLSRVPGVRTLITLVFFVGALLRMVPSCDIVHHLSCSHLYFFIVTVPTVLVGRMFRKPVIINYRGGEAERFLEGWVPLVRPILRAGSVVVPSEFLQRIFKRFGVSSAIVPNIADPENFTFRARSRLQPRCISTRNLERLYNVRCTLEAFRLVQQVYPEAELAIAGDGDERPALERFVREQGLRHVTFHGVVDHASLAALYQQYDIFVNASNADNFPGAILEAASCGLPIVSTNAGGIPDLVQDGKMGLLVPVNDPHGLAEKILYLLDHPDVARQLAHNAWVACRHYAWASVYPQWQEIYGRMQTNG